MVQKQACDPVLSNKKQSVAGSGQGKFFLAPKKEEQEKTDDSTYGNILSWLDMVLAKWKPSCFQERAKLMQGLGKVRESVRDGTQS